MSQDFEAVIGLEVHAQLRTRTKLFCGCPTDFGAAPNAHVCPTCLGLPGALPVLNDEAVGMAVRAGLATGCRIAERSVFARKNYFYPDLPKGYQISQFDRPLCENGALTVQVQDRDVVVAIHRIHMEEDAGKSIHAGTGAGHSLIDLNRACVPLVEIVSEPDLRSADEAVAYLRELRAILLWIGVCDGNMEQGSFRCDANVSIRPRGTTALGTRCEIKNMNSFRAVRDAITWEIGRQIRLTRSGDRVVQQTRLWDADRGRTEAMRSKEEAHDYRYFPDPDLLDLQVSRARIDGIRASLPELPAARRARFVAELGVSGELAEALCDHPERALAFEAALGANPDAARAGSFADFLYVRAAGAIKGTARDWPDLLEAMTPLLQLHDAWREGALSNRMLTEVFTAALAAPGPLSDALRQAQAAAGSVLSSPDDLAPVVERVLAAHEGKVTAYRAGQAQLLGFFMGQVMRACQGKADAQAVQSLLRARLDAAD